MMNLGLGKRKRYVRNRDPTLSPLIPRMPGYAARDIARPPAGIWWDANRRLQTTNIFGAMDDFKRHRSMGINYVYPLFPRNLSSAWTSPVEEEETEESNEGDWDAGDSGEDETVEEVKASEPRWKTRLLNRRWRKSLRPQQMAWAEEATEDKAAFPVFGSMWRLRNRRLAEEFAAAADEAGADKAKEDKAGRRRRRRRRHVPVFGSMWVRHAEHGLVRCSARIAARNN